MANGRTRSKMRDMRKPKVAAAKSPVRQSAQKRRRRERENGMRK